MKGVVSDSQPSSYLIVPILDKLLMISPCLNMAGVVANMIAAHGAAPAAMAGTAGMAMAAVVNVVTQSVSAVFVLASVPFS